MKDFFFSYFYYRITQAYFRWDNKNSSTAAIGIAMVQTILPFDILVLTLAKIADRKIKGPLYPSWIAYAAVVVLIFLIIYNWRKYYNKYDQFKMKWKDESKLKRVLKGLLILFFMILPWAIMIPASELKWYQPPGTP